MDRVLLIWVLFGIILLIISIGDFLFFRIEDEYVTALVVLYIVSCASGVSGGNFYNGLITAVVTFIGTLIMNHCGLIGGGDVKMLFPVILLSEDNLIMFLVGISLGGAMLSLIYIIFGRQIFFFRRKIVSYLCISKKKKKKCSFLNIILLSLSRIDKRIVALKNYTVNAMRQEIPYGIAISCGGFYVIFEKIGS
jgi:Flp pilus assembly protein protease CpaA